MSSINDLIPHYGDHEAPPAYEGKAARAATRQFYIKDRNFGAMVSSFASKSAYEQYRQLQRALAAEKAAWKEKQNEGYAIPLLTTTSHLGLSMGDHKIMSVSRSVLDHTAQERLLDPEVDSYEYCVVYLKKCSGYHRYRFVFTPEQAAPELLFEVSLFVHDRNPFADFKFKGERYRWYTTLPSRVGLEEFWYDLYRLDRDQPSLVDNLRDGQPNPDNELFRSELRKQGFTVKSDGFRSLFRVGMLRCYPIKLDDELKRPHSTSFVLSQRPKDDKMSRDVDTTELVLPESQVFLLMALLYKKLQNDMQITIR